MSQTSTVEKPANTASIILGAENGGPLRHARAKIASTSVHYIAQLCKSLFHHLKRASKKVCRIFGDVKIEVVSAQSIFCDHKYQ